MHQCIVSQRPGRAPLRGAVFLVLLPGTTVGLSASACVPKSTGRQAASGTRTAPQERGPTKASGDTFLSAVPKAVRRRSSRQRPRLRGQREGSHYVSPDEPNNTQRKERGRVRLAAPVFNLRCGKPHPTNFD